MRNNIERLTRSLPLTWRLGFPIYVAASQLAPFLDGACSERSRSARNGSKGIGEHPRKPSWLMLAFAPIQNDLAGVAGFHQLDGFLELCVGEAVGNHRRDVETGLDHRGHFGPALK